MTRKYHADPQGMPLVDTPDCLTRLDLFFSVHFQNEYPMTFKLFGLPRLELRSSQEHPRLLRFFSEYRRNEVKGLVSCLLRTGECGCRSEIGGPTSPLDPQNPLFRVLCRQVFFFFVLCVKDSWNDLASAEWIYRQSFLIGHCFD